MKRNNNIVKYCMILFALIIVCLGMIISLEYIKNENVYFIIKNIIIITYTLSCVLSIIMLKKYINIISIILIIANSISLFGKLYFIPIRLYYKILVILFFISLLHTIAILIIKAMRKANKEIKIDVPLINALIPTLFISCSYFMNTSYLFETVAMMTSKVISLSFIIGLVLAITGILIYLIVRKDKTNKKAFFGGMTAVFFTTLILGMFMMFGTINNINYGFDKTIDNEEYCIILDKEVRYTSKVGQNHYIIFMIDEEEFTMKVNKMIYNQYNVGDQILIYKCNGSLGYSYYEYQMDSIYKYNNK